MPRCRRSLSPFLLDRMTYERVLVTGGAGFVGSHLVDALVQRGARVVVLDDLSTGGRTNLAAHLGGSAVRLLQGTVMDADAVVHLVGQVDIVYHLAAAVGVRNIVRQPLESILTNVRGTENVLAAAHERGVPVLVASTSEVYGRNPDVPFREDAERVLGPTWIHRWSYSTAKAIDEHLAFAYAERGLPVSIVRYFNAYGPRIDERGYGSVIARFAAQALAGEPITVHGDGTQSRCFTFVEDTVRGTILAAESPGARGAVVNIGSAEEVTILQLAALVRDLLGSSSPIDLVSYASYYGADFEDTRRRVPDTRRAADLLGFIASTPLRDGLVRTLEWCREHYGVEQSR